MDKEAYLSDFPDELLFYISQFLSPQDLLGLCLTSKRFYFLWGVPGLWKGFLQRDFNKISETPQKSYIDFFSTRGCEIACGESYLAFTWKDKFYRVELPANTFQMSVCQAVIKEVSAPLLHQFSTEYSHIGILQDSRVSCWGSNSEGQLGTGFYGQSYSRESFEPMNLSNVTGKPIKVSCGRDYTAVLTDQGKLYLCGGVSCPGPYKGTILKEVPVDCKIKDITLGGRCLALNTENGLKMISLLGQLTDNFPQFHPTSVSVNEFLTFIIDNKNLYCIGPAKQDYEPIPFLEEPYQVSVADGVCGGLDKKGFFLWTFDRYLVIWRPSEPPSRPDLPFEPLKVSIGYTFAAAVTRKGVVLWKWVDWDGTYRLLP